MTKTIFEEMGGTYRQVGDYLLPNITVPAEEEIEPIGLWGYRSFMISIANSSIKY